MTTNLPPRTTAASRAACSAACLAAFSWSSFVLAQGAPPPPPAPNPAPPPAAAPTPPPAVGAPAPPPPAVVPAAPATAPGGPASLSTGGAVGGTQVEGGHWPPPPSAAPEAPSETPVPPPQAPAPYVPPPLSGDGERAWHDAFEYRIFGDAYFSLNANFPKPQSGRNEPTRAYDTTNGFALSWVGFDVSRDADPVGGTVSLRFGPSAEAHGSRCMAADPGAQCDSAYGLAPVKQAFLAWKPGGEDSPFRIDFGKFDTIYGVEVAESQFNINYTRGVLYRWAEPQFHTGLRLGYELSPNFSATALVVNGWNNTVDNNTGKTYGIQLKARALGDAADDERLSVKLGYLLGGERDDIVRVRCGADQAFDPDFGGCASSPGTPAANYPVDQADSNTLGLQHFVNLALTADPVKELRVIVNGDLGIEKRRERDGSDVFDNQMFWGAMIGARYGFSDEFGIGLRGEYFSDADGNRVGEGDLTLLSGTLTLDYLPTENLILRLENRADKASRDVFAEGVRDVKDLLFTTTVGVVATTN